MRSGSSFRRYSASRSWACLRGPPVSRTAERGSGRATSGMAGLMGLPPAKSARNTLLPITVALEREVKELTFMWQRLVRQVGRVRQVGLELAALTEKPGCQPEPARQGGERIPCPSRERI